MVLSSLARDIISSEAIRSIGLSVTLAFVYMRLSAKVAIVMLDCRSWVNKPNAVSTSALEMRSKLSTNSQLPWATTPESTAEINRDREPVALLADLNADTPASNKLRLSSSVRPLALAKASLRAPCLRRLSPYIDVVGSRGR